jgi:hypothetical protein
MQTEIKDQITVLEQLASHGREAVQYTMSQNPRIAAMVDGVTFNHFHNMPDKDRKMINGMIRPTMALELGMNTGELEAIIVRLHETTTVGIASTTESDAFDLIYNYELDDLIDQLKVAL